MAQITITVDTKELEQYLEVMEELEESFDFGNIYFLIPVKKFDAYSNVKHQIEQAAIEGK